MTALVATTQNVWRGKIVDTLFNCACDVHTTASGVGGVDLLRKHQYEIVVFDDSLEMSPLEFALVLREFQGERSVVLVAAPEYRLRFERLGKATLADVVSSASDVVECIPSIISIAEVRAGRNACAK